MVRIGGMRFEESAHGARNPQAGETQILHGIAEIDVLEERKRQAEEFMAWFQPAWDALGEDEKTVLTFCSKVTIHVKGSLEQTAQVKVLIANTEAQTACPAREVLTDNLACFLL